MRPHLSLCSSLAYAALLLWGRDARAQVEYHDLESGRPLRLEDADVGERHRLELQFAPFRVERTSIDGVRLRLEPAIAYGALPNTEIQVRLPLVSRQRDGRRVSGLAGVGLAAAHNFLAESAHLPAITGSVGLLLPAGKLRSETATYGGRLAVTRSFGWGRLHLNAGYSTAYLRLTSCVGAASATACEITPIDHGGAACSQTRGSIPARFACASVPSFSTAPAAQVVPDTTAQPVAPVKRGHSMLGLGIDRALPLRSVVLLGDVYAERFEGSSRLEITAESGVRVQWMPRVVLDLGVGRHFTGGDRAWMLVAGATYSRSFLTRRR